MPKSKTRKKKKPLEKTLAAVHKALEKGTMTDLTDVEKRRVNLFTLRQQGKKRRRTREQVAEQEKRARLLMNAPAAARWGL